MSRLGILGEAFGGMVFANVKAGLGEKELGQKATCQPRGSAEEGS